MANILLLQSYKNKENKNIFSIYFILLLFTHESALFLLPFFIYIFYKDRINPKDYVPVLFTVLIYILFYFAVNSNQYDISFYFLPLLSDPFFWFRDSYGVLIIGIFSSIKFLLFYVLYALYKIKPFQFEWIIYFLLITCQLFIAGDLTRFYIVLFLPIVELSRHLFDYKLNLKHLNYLLVMIIFLNIATPKYYVFAPGEVVKVNDSKIHFLDLYRIQS